MPSEGDTWQFVEEAYQLNSTQTVLQRLMQEDPVELKNNSWFRTHTHTETPLASNMETHRRYQGHMGRVKQGKGSTTFCICEYRFVCHMSLISWPRLEETVSYHLSSLSARHHSFGARAPEIYVLVSIALSNSSSIVLKPVHLLPQRLLLLRCQLPTSSIVLCVAGAIETCP